MRTHAHVVVIGGGAVGASVLYHLALAGITDTVLLERDELTSGSTWHAAGNVPTYANGWLGMRAGNYAWRLYRELAEDPDRPITYRHTGAFWPAHTRERMELFRHLAGVSRSAGFSLRMVTTEEMEGMHPYWRANGGVIGGIHDPYEGDIDPSQLTRALAEGARARGAEVARFTPVTGLAQKPSGEWVVETPAGAVTAGVVVNAAGFHGAEVAALAGQSLPIAVLEHQYLVTGPVAALGADPTVFPLVRDPDLRFYLRRERDAFLLGSYAHAGRPVWPDGPPADFAHQLFPDRVDDILAVLEAALGHVPLLGEAGVQRFVNGPIAYAPDALPLVGPAAGLENFYHATGVQIGITHAAAIGKAMAEWITEGETEWDLAAWDPRRFGPWATPAYARARAAEMYDLQYAIPYPHRILRSGRPVQRTPLYERLVERGAVMGQIGGWERAFWFRRGADADPDPDRLSFHEEPWHGPVRRECETVRDAVGLMDHGGFTKYRVEGPGTERFLSRVFCGRVPAPGRVRLGYLLTPKGRIWSEATIARLAPDRALLCGPTLADQRDLDWLRRHLPGDGSATLTRGFEQDGALLLMGPRARAVLAALAGADPYVAAAPWMSVARLRIAGIETVALRVSYVGEHGFELHVASRDLAALYAALVDAGAPHGLCDFGSYALDAMRIEKGYHAWGADIGTEYTLFDAGLARFADLGKRDFVGRAAVLEQARVPAEWTFVGLEITEPGPDALASDPIVRDGEWIGYVTSAATGFRTGKQLALGYVRTGHLALGEACAVTVLGEDRRAVRHAPCVYDPENRRLRG